MSREWRLYLHDMLLACDKVARFVHGINAKQFLSDERTYDTVVRNLEIIGEAAKHVPGDIRRKMPKVPWKKIAGMRDWLAHAYFGIDFDILWDVIQNKAPELRQHLLRFESRYCPDIALLQLM